MATCGGGTIIETEYRGEDVQYDVSVSMDGFEWSLGMTEPVLLKPIDYDAELAEREKTHEPISDVDGDLGNRLFGV
jgi:hypothetical protein